MIKEIHIVQYRKLKDLDLEFSPSINAISGANGTCKSSLLHIISNSFQAVSSKAEFLKDNKCMTVIKSVNSVMNPKVEGLTRGDQLYNDPAHGIKGTLFSVSYYGHSELNFRRHNSKISNRYAIKPMYQTNAHDSLPKCPVIYLGISRLVPFGEYLNDEAVSNIKIGLPDNYLNEISEIYKSFTHYDISKFSIQKMGDIKKRSQFNSDAVGVDSNTVSAGEDNLLIIITALVSLRYYFECIESHNEIESLLLIDELDATLHPAYQIKLLNLFRTFAKKYKIQIIFTTHSISILENIIKKKENFFYFIDNITDVALMKNPDIFKIRMHLSGLTQNDIYYDKVIPVFTEDQQSRIILNTFFNFFEDTFTEFKGCKRFFYMPDVNFGGENLTQMFKDSQLLRMTMKSICILDGDKCDDLNNCIITLPGKNAEKSGSGNNSPENLLIEYADILFTNDDPFWTEEAVIDGGFGKIYYQNHILDKINSNENKEAEGCAKKQRIFNKKLFIKEEKFFVLLFKNWLRNPNNKNEINKFYINLNKLFLKMATYNGINPNEWRIGQ